MNRRHRARRLALQGLCCLDVQGPEALGLVEQFIDESKDPLAVRQLAHTLLLAALADRDECDRVLARHAKHWDLPRLAMVDRNILRLGASELHAGHTPTKVVINEALLLAKEFSTAQSPRFINGVLDSVAKEIAADAGENSRDAGDAGDEEERGRDEEEKETMKADEEGNGRDAGDAGDEEERNKGEEEDDRDARDDSL